MYYEFYDAEFEITDDQYEDFSSAIGTYNSLIDGDDASQIVNKWNIPTGSYYGIIVDVNYSTSSNNEPMVTFQVLLDSFTALTCNVKTHGLLSEWRRTYKRHFGTFAYDSGDELIGMAVNIYVYTAQKFGEKPFSTIKGIRFISNSEIDIIDKLIKQERYENSK